MRTTFTDTRTKQRSSQPQTLHIRHRGVDRVQNQSIWSRYEQFSLVMVLLLSGMILAVTAGLHFLNYGLETQSSSTSGSHTDFHSGSQQADQ